jgi:hypothetical protein
LCPSSDVTASSDPAAACLPSVVMLTSCVSMFLKEVVSTKIVFLTLAKLSLSVVTSGGTSPSVCATTVKVYSPIVGSSKGATLAVGTLPVVSVVTGVRSSGPSGPVSSGTPGTDTKPLAGLTLAVSLVPGSAAKSTSPVPGSVAVPSLKLLNGLVTTPLVVSL